MLARRVCCINIPLRSIPLGKSCVTSVHRRCQSTAAQPDARPLTKDDYLLVLGLNSRADAGDIKQAYYKLSMLYHPDRNPNDAEAHDKFIAVLEAYERLQGHAVNPIDRMAEERKETWKTNTESIDKIIRDVTNAPRIVMGTGRLEDPLTYHTEEALEHDSYLKTQIRNLSMVSAAVLALIAGIHYVEYS